MSNINVILVLLNTGAGFWAIRRWCVKDKGFEFNHVLMFTLGFLLYWIFPIGIGLLGLFHDVPAMQLWYAAYDDVPAEKLTGYLAATLVIYLGFLGGDALGRGLGHVGHRGYRPLFFYKRLLIAPFAVGIVLGLVYLYLLRDQLFRGYNLIDIAEASDLNRGSFNSVNLLLLDLALIFTLKKIEDAPGAVRFGRVIRNIYMATYAIFALLALSLGGRLYMLSSIVMVLVFATCYFGRLPLTRTALIVAVGVVVFAVLGIVRQSQDYSAERFVTTALAEPMYTSFSVMHFLSSNPFEILKFPVFLLSQFLNLVPTALLPGKADLMLDPNDFGYTVYSPGGAMHSFFSFMINFGVLGTIMAMAAFGAFMGYLRARDANLLQRTMYITFCGWIGFTFFRDPFSVSIVKTMFEFSFVLPIAIVVVAQMVSISLRAIAPSRSAHPEPSS